SSRTVWARTRGARAWFVPLVAGPCNRPATAGIPGPAQAACRPAGADRCSGQAEVVDGGLDLVERVGRGADVVHRGQEDAGGVATGPIDVGAGSAARREAGGQDAHALGAVRALGLVLLGVRAEAAFEQVDDRRVVEQRATVDVHRVAE